MLGRTKQQLKHIVRVTTPSLLIIIVTSIEFKVFVLDKYYSNLLSEDEKISLSSLLEEELQDKIQISNLLEYCNIKQITVGAASANLQVSGTSVLFLILHAFRALYKGKLARFKDRVKALQRREWELN
jgi:hypothetical protein